MNRPVAIAAFLALAACNGADSGEAPDFADPDVATIAEVDPNADAGFEAVAPGNYAVHHSDGSVDELTILPGMTWAMVFADGTPAGGTIFAQDGKNCFVTEGEPGHQCFAGSKPDANGAMQVTAEDGEVMTVTPVESFDSVRG